MRDRLVRMIPGNANTCGTVDDGSPKSLICIAYYFPPIAVSGSHRTRAIVKHLPCHGWRSVVVTVREKPGSSNDPALLLGLPKDLIVYRTYGPNLLALANKTRYGVKRLVRPFSPSTASRPSPSSTDSDGESERNWIDWASWWLQIPDQAVGWLPFGLATALHAIHRHHGCALYSSAPYWTTHLIGLLAKRVSGLPWVADFRDPWRANPFRQLSYPSVDRFDAWLERQVVEHADRVVCNSDFVREDFIRRYPDRVDRFATIPNGFDPEDYTSIEPRREAGPDRLVLTHAGEFYGPRRPAPIFQALRCLQDQRRLSRVPCLQLLGSPTFEGRSLQSIATDHGVEDRVMVKGQVSHQQTLEALRGSDIQLLVGFNGEGSELQVPAKLFEYLAVGRPILALAPERSAIANVLEQAGVPSEICDPNEPAAIADAIARMDLELNLKSDVQSRPVGRSITRFHRREQVSQLAELLQSALVEHDTTHRPYP